MGRETRIPVVATYGKENIETCWYGMMISQRVERKADRAFEITVPSDQLSEG